MRFFQKKERVGGMLVISSLSGKKWFNLLITMTKIMLEFQCSGTFAKKKISVQNFRSMVLCICTVADLFGSMQFEASCRST